MTIDEFIEELKNLRTSRLADRQWEMLRTSGAIRLFGEYCPIEAVANIQGWGFAADKLGLSHSVRNEIAAAADGINYNRKLRARMLNALGLFSLE